MSTDTPPPRENLIYPSGQVKETWWRWFSSIARDLGAAEDGIDGLPGPNGVDAFALSELPAQVEAALVQLRQIEDLRAQLDLLRGELPLRGAIEDLRAQLSGVQQQVAEMAVSLTAPIDIEAPVIPETGQFTIRDNHERFATVKANRDTAHLTGNSVTMAGSGSAQSPLRGVTVEVDAASVDTNVAIVLRPKGSGAIQLKHSDGTVGSGNIRGANAVDLQSFTGTAATQVASGLASFAAGGLNTSSGQASGTIGSSCVASGLNAMAFGDGCTASGIVGHVMGSRGSDRTTQRVRVFSSSRFATDGDMQIMEGLFAVTTAAAAAVRMTLGAVAAATTTVMALPNNSAFLVEAKFLAYDVTTGAALVYTLGPSLITRGANAAATVVSVLNPAFVLGPTTAGPPALAAIPTFTADVTNGGMNFSVTPPAANTDTWRFITYVRAVQTQ